MTDHRDPPPAREPALPHFLNRFVTPEAVYGLVLYAAIVAAASDEAEGPDAADATLVLDDTTIVLNDSVAILIWVILSTIVFWGAHVFAHAVAGHGVRNGQEVSVGQATRLALASSAVSEGVLPTRTPAASSASFLAAAVPDEPDTIAPACPIVLPSGAVKPAT